MTSSFADLSASKACANCGATFYRDRRNTWAYWGKAKFCSRECAGAKIASDKVARRPAREVAFRKWFATGGGCWEWQGAVDRDGYGIFSYAGKTSRAARVSLEFDGRPLSGAEMACHRCDNPRCVRPDHLFAGTNQDNMQDMVRKGRNPDRFGPNNPNWRGGISGRSRVA